MSLTKSVHHIIEEYTNEAGEKKQVEFVLTIDYASNHYELKEPIRDDTESRGSKLFFQPHKHAKLTLALLSGMQKTILFAEKCLAESASIYSSDGKIMPSERHNTPVIIQDPALDHQKDVVPDCFREPGLSDFVEKTTPSEFTAIIAFYIIKPKDSREEVGQILWLNAGGYFYSKNKDRQYTILELIRENFYYKPYAVIHSGLCFKV